MGNLFSHALYITHGDSLSAEGAAGAQGGMLQLVAAVARNTTTAADGG